MAGTWLPEGTRERLSVQGGVTVAKSQTLALYTIRVFADEIRTGITGGSGRAVIRHVLCFFLSQQLGRGGGVGG